MINERRGHVRDWGGSEAVIMLSREDMDMVADLMHLKHTEDDREFFDCGDDDDDDDGYNDESDKRYNKSYAQTNLRRKLEKKKKQQRALAASQQPTPPTSMQSIAE